WEWDGAQWTQVATALGTNARAHAAAAYDVTRGQVVLFGGFDIVANHHLSDTWTWNGTAWTQVATSGPTPRGAHAMGFDARTSVVLLYGGLTDTNGASRETWAWNGTSWTRLSNMGPVDM